MDQIDLFESLDERERRNQEVRHPLLMAGRTSVHVGWLLVLSMAIASFELGAIRLAYGLHDQGQEIVVISTPIMFGYLCVRLLRTRIQPAEEAELAKLPRPTFRDFLSALFALGLLLMVMIIVSGFVYRHFEIQWAAQAAFSLFRRGCVGMTGLAGIIFVASEQGRKHIRKVVRIWIAIPGLCGNALATLFPKPRRMAIWH